MRVPLKVSLDMLLVCVFLLLMADRYTDNFLHEMLGLLVSLLTLWHICANKQWFVALGRGRHTRLRAGRLALNILLIASMLGTLASAVCISHTLFAFAGFKGDIIYKTIHICCAHWLFLLGAVHCGLYWQRVCANLTHLSPAVALCQRCSTLCPMVCIAARVLAGVVALYGGVAFVSRDIWFPLTMASAFMPWDPHERFVVFLFDYAAIFWLGAWIGDGFFTLCRAGNVTPRPA